MMDATSSTMAPHRHEMRPSVVALLAGLHLLIGVFAISSLVRPYIDSPPARMANSPAAPPAAVLQPPAVAPMIVAALTPDDARASNAKVPIDTSSPAKAKPFIFSGTEADRARALTCLAAAMLYEAGDDRIGEQAVGQVVLNRLRHPAFPKSVCGVVLQGSERTTGCQFTFTCDGSVTRVPGAAAWQRAMALAEEALSGSVLKQVGMATHYHTDWVVPYWRDSVDKIAQIHTHIFYRWQGWWGTPGAFSSRNFEAEQIGPALASLAPAETATVLSALTAVPVAVNGEPAPLPKSLTAEGVATTEMHGNVIHLMDARIGRYVLRLDPAAYPGSYAVTAYAICRVRPSCEVSGWVQPAMLPADLSPSPASVEAMTFRYVKTSVSDPGDARWNCKQVRRDDPGQCLAGTGGR